MELSHMYILFDDGTRTEPRNVVMDKKINNNTIEITMDDFKPRIHKGNYEEYKALWWKWWEE